MLVQSSAGGPTPAKPAASQPTRESTPKSAARQPTPAISPSTHSTQVSTEAIPFLALLAAMMSGDPHVALQETVKEVECLVTRNGETFFKVLKHCSALPVPYVS